jgi:hypothetical protein
VWVDASTLALYCYNLWLLSLMGSLLYLPWGKKNSSHIKNLCSDCFSSWSTYQEHLGSLGHVHCGHFYIQWPVYLCVKAGSDSHIGQVMIYFFYYFNTWSYKRVAFHIIAGLKYLLNEKYFNLIQNSNNSWK